MKALALSKNIYSLMELYTKKDQAETTISKDIYTSKKRLSSKIYSTIDQSKISKNFVKLFVDKTKKLKSNLDSLLFFKKNSDIYSLLVSDTEALRATLTDNTTEGIDYVNVLQLAKKEIYKSKKILPNDNELAEPGTYTFQIDINSNVYTVELTIPPSDNLKNKDILTYIEYAINVLNIDVVAEIFQTQKRSLNEFDPDLLENYIYLQISTNNSGNNINLYIADLENNLIEKLELTKKDIASQDLEYILNSEPKKSPINYTTEKNGALNLDFKQKTSDLISIKITKNKYNFSKNLKEIIDSYNQYIEWTNEYSYFMDYKFKTSLSSILKKHYNKLNEIFLKPDKDGRLSQKPFFEKIINISPNKILSVLFGNNGFFQDIKNLANEIINSPTKFIKSESTLILYSRYGDTTGNDEKSSSLDLNI